MSGSASERARTLELIIRAAAAEERLLGRRLQRIAESQRKTRDEIARELRREHFGQPPAQDGQPPAQDGQSPAQDGQPPARDGQLPGQDGQPPGQDGSSER